jgi:SWI/SNF-related matrix-associated actin-dependent regulator 1 of chromatin subfamily A
VPVVLDSGPVIEILHEPASGVVTSARDERTEPRAKHPDEIPIAEFWSVDRDRSGAVRAAAEPEPGPVAQGDRAAAAAQGDRAAAAAQGDRAAAAAQGDRAAAAAQGDRAAAEPRRVVRPPPERDAGAAQDSGDDFDAEPARRSRLPLVILIVVLLGAGGYLVYQYYLKGNLAAATKVTPVPAARASPPDGAAGSREAAGARGAAGNLAIVEPHGHRAAAAVVIDVTAAVEQARATLRADLTATSPRVQRIAAEALARTQDPAARDVLAAQLGLPAAADAQPRGSAAAPPRERETSDIAKLDLAYSLARGGDPRGVQALAAALGSQRAEVRDEAARLLALLGDARAVPHLTDLLAVSQRRLGAAEHLAHLAEPHAIKVLEQIRGDAKAATGDRARATIALGIARHADVAPALRDMLGNPHENAFVAAALAELKDAAARPILEQQLESPALRVRAARALRRLDPALDPRPVLARLIEILTTGRDIDQVQAAEAILLLAGPASWSAYD